MFKLIAVVFAAMLAVVAAKPGLIATGYAAAPALSSSYSYQSYGAAPLAYSGYIPSGYSAYNGYTGLLGYNQLGYNYAGPYNYYL